jgi:biotin operon repressor
MEGNKLTQHKDNEYLNLATGEVKEFAFTRTPEQQKAFQERQKREGSRKKAKAFTFSDMENAKEVIEMLTTTELGYFLVLQTYVRYEDNVLIKSTHKPVPMKRKDIGEVLGITNRSHIKKHVDNLLDKGMMSITTVQVGVKEVDAFVINNHYHFKGRTENKKVAKTFSEQIRKLYQANINKKNKRKPADMGFLYLILPYINYENNVLCFNPFETDGRDIVALSVADICRITGLDKKNVQSKINNLKWDGMTVFAKVLKGRKTHLKVNPFVFYRKDGEPDKSLQADFLIRGNKE